MLNRFPFKSNCLRCVCCVNENHKKRKRLRWQAANHCCHCFDRAFLLAGACVSCGFRLRNARNACDCVWMETGLYSVWGQRRHWLSEWENYCRTIRRTAIQHECNSTVCTCRRLWRPGFWELLYTQLQEIIDDIPKHDIRFVIGDWKHTKVGQDITNWERVFG